MSSPIRREEVIGNQRLILGDCLEVLPTLEAGSVDAVVTDPPYGMTLMKAQHGAQTERHFRLSQRNQVIPMQGDEEGFDPMPALSLVSCKEQFVWGGDWLHDKLPAGGSWIVWDKRASLASDAIPGSPFEVCWSKQRHKREFIRYPWGGWNSTEGGERERWHPAQKPVFCMEFIIARYTQLGQVVCDPFLGSGTTLVAAELLGRRGTGIEIEEKYWSIACKRVEAATKQPRLNLEPVVKPEQLRLEP